MPQKTGSCAPGTTSAEIGMSRGTFLGAWSGQCLPEFEAPPPEWTRRYWGTLCIREFDKDVWSNLPLLPETMPCGALKPLTRASTAGLPAVQSPA